MKKNINNRNFIIKWILHSTLRIHFPSMIPSSTLRVLLHAPFSSVDAITWVTLVSHFFRTVTLVFLSNSETTSYIFSTIITVIEIRFILKKIAVDFYKQTNYPI